MSQKIYKYVGPSYLDKVLVSKEHLSLKCSYPKDFNDPYELFLTIDFNERPGALAFYSEAVGSIPQLPTTCFSRTPSVVPMWAHYAQNSQGFAIEFDEAKLAESFPKSGFGDVDYQDEPKDGLRDLLYRAYEIGKPRYVYLLNAAVFSAAYYTKNTCWSYERERRMIVDESETCAVDGLILMNVPSTCVTALICGPRATVDTINAVRAKAEQMGCKYFQMKIGKISSESYFVDSSGSPFVFAGTQIEPSETHCGSCKEPLAVAADQCSWCQIDESHESEAATRNPYRMLAHFGMLESYISNMQGIDRDGKGAK